MSYLLFQAGFAVYFVAAVIYTVFFFSQKAQIRIVARIVFVLAASLHTLNIIFRYIEAGHTPITSIHETISFFAWSIACCHLSFRWRYTVKNSGTFASIIVLLLMLASSLASREILPLPPEMRSWLLPVHASISIIADAFLALAAIGGIMYLLQERELKQKRFGFFFSRLPSLDALDKLNQHCISIGFPLMTLGMLAGYIWARQIWGGRPWHWNPKVVCAMITWLFYAGLMHQRFTLGWRGRRAAWITVIAFCAVLLTFWFVLSGGWRLMGHESIVLLGVNHKKTPLEIREKMALTGGYVEPLEKLRELDGLKEYYLLSTCNRVEILFICQDPEEMRREVLDLLFLGKVSREEVAGCFYVYENEEAIRHLFMVSSSLDSMIVGESQILGQLKEAFRHATEQKTAGLVINKLLHKSFSVAKRVRTETRIGANAVSISYAAVELGRKIFGDLRGKRVMLVGAGEMAELAAEHLVGQGIQEVVVANRTLERAMKLAARFKGRAVGLDEVVEQLLDVDILISSTGAEGLVLFKKDIAPLMPRRRNRPLFFIDIAVPRDLDPEINTLENIYLYDIDDLNNVVEMNREQRDKEAVKAQRIVEEETLKFQRWLEGMEVTPTIVDLRAVAEAICQAELAKTLPRLNGISSKERKSIERMASSIVGKMLHHPMCYLKADHGCVDQSERIMQVRALFQLNEQSDQADD